MTDDYPDFVTKVVTNDPYKGRRYTCTCRPVCRQPYANCYFEAGLVEGHPVDTMYLRLFREGKSTMIYLRPDEAAALAWVLNGALWSSLIKNEEEK